jgi:hypothetical protein
LERPSLHGYLFEAENFEYFPEQNGYLFLRASRTRSEQRISLACWQCDVLSQEKAQFLQTTSDGQRRLFKQHPQELAINADVVLEERSVTTIPRHCHPFKPNNDGQDSPAPPNRGR